MATCRFSYDLPMNSPAFDKASNTGLRHLLNATRFSVQGLVAAFRLESAFRQELALLLILTPLGVWIAESARDFVLLMAFSILVLVVELLNSGIEASIDRAGEDYNEFARLGKDYGSAAVMLALLAAGLVWLTMLLEKFGLA